MTVDLVQVCASDDMVAQAAKVSTQGSNRAEATQGFIDFLWRNEHRSPFEHNMFTFYVECPIFVSREIIRHRTCVTGSTMVQLCSPKNVANVRHRSIENIWENWHLGVPDTTPRRRKVDVKYRSRYKNWRVSVKHNLTSGHEIEELGVFETEEDARAAARGVDGTFRRRKLPSCRNIHAVSIDEGTESPIPNKVLGVEKMGVKPVYRVTTEDGHEVDVTADHEFRSAGGRYVSIDGGLAVGDLVNVRGVVGVSNPNPEISRHLREGIGHWTTRQRTKLLRGEGNGTCYICGSTFPAAQLDADHVVPVVEDLSLALSYSNLALACKACHRAKTNGEQSIRPRGQNKRSSVVSVAIKSIDYLGEEEVYDISMSAPNHNFIGNGLVLHNCSFNEESARYRELDGVFFCPDSYRPLVQVGKTGDYNFESGDNVQKAVAEESYIDACEQAWRSYREMLDSGIAKEVARGVLPVTTFTSLYMTVNARTLMHFLDLRLDHHAQAEIREVAEKMVPYFRRHMPMTVEAWQKYRA